jgi:hypothetical protein
MYVYICIYKYDLVVQGVKDISIWTEDGTWNSSQNGKPGLPTIHQPTAYESVVENNDASTSYGIACA